jgi:PST family polysaccharide transporter
MPGIATIFKNLRNKRGVEKSGIMLISVGSRALGQLLLNKLIAVFAGPAGIAFLSQFHNLLAGLLIIPAEGVNRALVSLVPPATTEQKPKFIFAGFLWNVAFVCLAACLIFALLPQLHFSDAGQDLRPNPYILTALVGFHAFLLFQLNHFIINASIKLYTLFITLGQVTGIVLGLIGWWLGRLDLIIYLYFLGQALPNLVAWLYRWIVTDSGALQTIVPTGAYQLQAVKKIAPFMLIALVSLVAGKLTDQFAMLRCNHLLGTAQLGLWQALVRISDLLIIPYATVMSGLAFPWLAKNLNNPIEVSRMIRKWVVILLGGGVAGFWVYKWLLPVLIMLVHSKSFMPAIAYADFQIIGDLLRLPAYLLGYLLLARQQTWTFLAMEMLSAVSYVLLIIFLPGQIDAGFFTLAYSIRMGIYLLAMMVVNKDYIK